MTTMLRGACGHVDATYKEQCAEPTIERYGALGWLCDEHQPVLTVGQENGVEAMPGACICTDDQWFEELGHSEQCKCSGNCGC